MPKSHEATIPSRPAVYRIPPGFDSPLRTVVVSRARALTPEACLGWSSSFFLGDGLLLVFRNGFLDPSVTPLLEGVLGMI